MENEDRYEKDFKDFAALLNKHGVDYLIVGAYTVIYHTRVARFTKDIDFWIRPMNENAQKCAEAVKEFFGLDVKKEDLLVPGAIHFIGQAPFRIDVFNAQGELDFEKAWNNKIEGKFRDVNVHYISREDLIALKQCADRQHDRKDVTRLNRKTGKRPKNARNCRLGNV